MKLCVICNNPITNRKKSDAMTCGKECYKEAARQRTRAIRKGTDKGWTRPKDMDPTTKARRYKLRSHGLDEFQVYDLSEEPFGFCNVCGKYSKLTIDHNHNHCPGQYGCSICLRGFLCSKCNIALGQVNDDVQILKNLISYLEEN